MALGLDGKKAIVAEVHEAAKSALSAVVADSRGVTVGKLTILRQQAREAGVTRVEGKEYIVKDGDVVEFKIGS